MRKTVLIVDPNRDATSTLWIYLTLYGYDVTVATDAGAALAEFGSRQPSIVLIDTGAPSIDAAALAHTLRQALNGQRVLFIAMSGWKESSGALPGPVGGFDHYLVKPYSVKELVRLMSSAP